MTVKRFTIVEYLPNVVQIKDNNQKLNSHEIVDLLNELVEENKQLYYEIQKVVESNECLLTQKRRWEECSDKYAELYEENKQLKEKNEQLLAKLKYTCEKINFSERLREMMK